MEETIEATQEEVAPKKKPGRPKKETQQVDDKILIYMQYGSGWVTASGVDFSYDHPYQLVPFGEAVYLLNQERFRKASADEVKQYYNA